MNVYSWMHENLVFLTPHFFDVVDRKEVLNSLREAENYFLAPIHVHDPKSEGIFLVCPYGAEEPHFHRLVPVQENDCLAIECFHKFCPLHGESYKLARIKPYFVRKNPEAPVVTGIVPPPKEDVLLGAIAHLCRLDEAIGKLEGELGHSILWVDARHGNFRLTCPYTWEFDGNHIALVCDDHLACLNTRCRLFREPYKLL